MSEEYEGYDNHTWEILQQGETSKSDLYALLKVVSKASDVALVAMFGIEGFELIKKLREEYL